jgi:acetyl-CoA carboxylase carboxyl transferase subunit alpha
VDTIGADPRVESEAEGIGNSIATSLGLMSTLTTPTLAVVIGEGGSGGALAMGAADWVMMQQNAFYSVISPEGAASIIFRDADKAARVAPDLRLTAHNLLDLGVVDEIVAESRGGAHADPDVAIDALHEALCRRLPILVTKPLDVLLAERYKKYRNMGAFETEAENG